jgi:molybdenum cofactor cytidylyltransferase
VGFARRYYGELAALSGDEGAKAIVRAHQRELQLIETDDAGVSRDIDKPADLAR